MNKKSPSTSRRRSGEKHAAILTAAAGLAADVGYSSSTIELIASRAGVGKQTIYRWWPSKAALYLEAYKALVAPVAMPSAEHCCRDRLQGFLTTLFRQYGKTSAGIILRGLIGEMASDEEVRQAVMSGLLLERTSVLQDPIQEGLDSGELDSELKAHDLADVIIALIWKQLLIEPKKLNARFATQVVVMALGEA
ncbi:MAG: TetR/AcrR family transcriptional regulator [Granulosicoccaceae bacterium]